MEITFLSDSFGKDCPVSYTDRHGAAEFFRLGGFTSMGSRFPEDHPEGPRTAKSFALIYTLLSSGRGTVSPWSRLIKLRYSTDPSVANRLNTCPTNFVYSLLVQKRIKKDKKRVTITMRTFVAARRPVFDLHGDRMLIYACQKSQLSLPGVR